MLTQGTNEIDCDMRFTTGNKRLDEAIRKELKVNRGGGYGLIAFLAGQATLK